MLDNICGYQEINHLAKDEQARLIQQAKYEAYTTLGLTGTATFYLILSLFVAFLTTKIIPTTLPPFIDTLLATIGFFLCYHLLLKSLVHRGLRSILTKQVQ